MPNHLANLLSESVPLGVLIVATISLIIYCVIIFSLWNIFTKAGRSGALALIPLYNLIVLIEISGLSLWYAPLFLVPGVNLVLYFILNYKLSKLFGHDLEFSIGLSFLPIVFFPILAFGNSSCGQVDSGVVDASATLTEFS